MAKQDWEARLITGVDATVNVVVRGSASEVGAWADLEVYTDTLSAKLCGLTPEELERLGLFCLDCAEKLRDMRAEVRP